MQFLKFVIVFVVLMKLCVDSLLYLQQVTFILPLAYLLFDLMMYNFYWNKSKTLLRISNHKAGAANMLKLFFFFFFTGLKSCSDNKDCKPKQFCKDTEGTHLCHCIEGYNFKGKQLQCVGKYAYVICIILLEKLTVKSCLYKAKKRLGLADTLRINNIKCNIFECCLALTFHKVQLSYRYENDWETIIYGIVKQSTVTSHRVNDVMAFKSCRSGILSANGHS